MRMIDQQFMKTPFYGSRRMTVSLGRSGEAVNRKRVQRSWENGPGGPLPQAADHHAAPGRAGLSLLAPRIGEGRPRRRGVDSDITYVPK